MTHAQHIKQNRKNRIMTKENIINTGLGVMGWTLANVPAWIGSISELITIISSVMGIAMLAVSIWTGVVNYRIKKIELEERRRNRKMKCEERRKSLQK